MSDKVKWRDAKPMSVYIEELEAKLADAIHRIEELEAESALDAERLRITIERAEMAEDERDTLKAALKKLEYWFDADQEVLDAMTPDERADHMRQLQMIREALNKGEE